jgi:catechol 2,3-dioxygenase
MTNFPYGVAPPNFRLPDTTRVGCVRLQVGSLRPSLDYYEQVLGLVTLIQDGDTAALGVEEADQPLIVLHARDGVRPAPRRGTFGLYHFAILLPDRASLGRFASHLRRLHVPAGSADHSVSESFYLTDPDGLGIEVYADRPRSAWQQTGRELVMTVEPLDVSGLVAIGGTEPWSRMPPGSSVGHMHLHVGDLEIADAFYHRALGFDKVVWSFPGALFLSAGGYHHHLATNIWSRGPAASEDQARLLEWQIVMPQAQDAAAAAQSLTASGFEAQSSASDWTAVDPWGTRLRLVVDQVRATGTPHVRCSMVSVRESTPRSSRALQARSFPRSGRTRQRHRSLLTERGD